MDAEISGIRQRASRHFLDGNYRSCIDLLSSAISTDLNNAALYEERAESYFRLQDHELAVEDLRVSISLSQNHLDNDRLTSRFVEMLDTLSVSRLRLGDNFGAILAAEEGLLLSPSNPLLLLHRAMANFGQRKLEEALVDARKLEQNPTCGIFATALCVNIQIEKGLLRKAMTELEFALLQYPGSEHLTRLYERLRDFLPDFLRKASDYIRQRKFESAMSTLDDALSIFPHQASLLFKKGLCLRYTGRYEAAVQSLLESISCMDMNASASSLAYNRDGGQEEKSLEDKTLMDFEMEVVLHAQKQLSLVLNDVAVRLYQDGKFSEALVYFSEAIKWRDNLPEFWINKGDCFARLNDPKSAEEMFRKALSLDPENSNAKLKLSSVHNQYGVNFFNSQRYLQAELEFSKAINTFARVPAYYFNRARTKMLLRKADQAVLDLVKAAEMDPRNGNLRAMITQMCPNLADKVGSIESLHDLSIRLEAEARRSKHLASSQNMPGTPAFASAEGEGPQRQWSTFITTMAPDANNNNNNPNNLSQGRPPSRPSSRQSGPNLSVGASASKETVAQYSQQQQQQQSAAPERSPPLESSHSGALFDDEQHHQQQQQQQRKVPIAGRRGPAPSSAPPGIRYRSPSPSLSRSVVDFQSLDPSSQGPSSGRRSHRPSASSSLAQDSSSSSSASVIAAAPSSFPVSFDNVDIHSRPGTKGGSRPSTRGGAPALIPGPLRLNTVSPYLEGWEGGGGGGVGGQSPQSARSLSVASYVGAQNASALSSYPSSSQAPSRQRGRDLSRNHLRGTSASPPPLPPPLSPTQLIASLVSSKVQSPSSSSSHTISASIFESMSPVRGDPHSILSEDDIPTAAELPGSIFVAGLNDGFESIQGNSDAPFDDSFDDSSLASSSIPPSASVSRNQMRSTTPGSYAAAPRSLSASRTAAASVMESRPSSSSSIPSAVYRSRPASQSATMSGGGAAMRHDSLLPRSGSPINNLSSSKSFVVFDGRTGTPLNPPQATAKWSSAGATKKRSTSIHR